MPIEFKIEKPADFRFAITIESHGWYALHPFEYDAGKKSLSYVFTDTSGRKCTIGHITEDQTSLMVRLSNSKVGLSKVERDVRHLFRLDDDLSGFYATVCGEPAFAWIAEAGAGRLLRSATVFEDLVKSMCTTNCSWSLTEKMVSNLVTKAGQPVGSGRFSFPTAGRLAEMDEKFFRDEIRAGYRAPYLAELAQRVAGGDVRPEEWLTSDLPTPELKKVITSVKGIGDYAAENLLKLIGRYDGLALDSWLRKRFTEKHGKKRTCDDKKIVKHYARYGCWKGLAIWCDLTEDWHN